MSYGVGPRSYLSRAKSAFEQGTEAGLFYTALELRCCIEARQAEYVEALAAYEGTKIRPWELGKTGKRIQNRSQNSAITMMRFVFAGGATLTTYHTPVIPELIGFAERTLHKLLHCQPKFRATDDEWWERTRAELKRGYQMAWLACQGDSLVPPLWDPATKITHPLRIELRGENSDIAEIINRNADQPMRVQVEYPDEPPAEWVCDL